MFVTDAGNREVMEYDGASGAILRWCAYGPGQNDVLNRTDVPAATRSATIPDTQGFDHRHAQWQALAASCQCLCDVLRFIDIPRSPAHGDRR